MALKVTKTRSDYLSDTAYAYDLAQMSQYFDKSVYEGLSSSGNQDVINQYLYGLAGAKDKTASAFNQHDYDYLSSPEDKANYALYKLSGIKDAQTEAYFQSKIQETIDRQTYESLNGFEKTMHTIGGVVGNAFNEAILGTVEGLLDAGIALVGSFGTQEWKDAAKIALAKDTTGVGAVRDALQTYSRQYTYLDKNKVWNAANDITTGIAQMVPMIAINYFAPGVGTSVYFAAGAGNAMSDAVNKNPDIDYAALLTYGASITALEFATEKLSGKLFGGTGNYIDDVIFGTSSAKSAKALGRKTASGLAGRLGINFLSEGLEESISEFAGVVLYNSLIAQGDDALRQQYSMTDILYAGFIGGLIGGVMEGGRIAGARKLTLSASGELIDTKLNAQLETPKYKNLSKTQSLVAMEKLSQAQQVLTQDAVADLQSKYSNLTLAQIQDLHQKEYADAVKQNEETKNKLIEVTLGLNRIFELAGAEGFKKAVDLANATYDTARRLAENYVTTLKGDTSTARNVEYEVKRIYGSDTSFTINTELTAEQRRLKNNIKNYYGYDVYFGDLGVLSGENKKFGLTIDENTIIIDPVQMGKMSQENILNKIVKEELVHTLQFTNGLITPKNIAKLHETLTEQGGIPSAQKLDKAYAEDTALTKVTEAQAKAFAELLLFDSITVDKLFKDNYKTINGVYKVLKGIKDKIESVKDYRKQKGKVKYNKVLHIMNDYRNIAFKWAFETDMPVKDFVSLYQVSPEEEKMLRETYLKKPEIGVVQGVEEAAFSKTGAIRQHLKKTKNISNIEYTKKGFSEEFAQLMTNPAPSDADIKMLLNDRKDNNSTGIGNEESTNAIIDFYYDKNKNVKTIDDVNNIINKDKYGYSPLAYALVFADIHKPKEGVKLSYVSEEARLAAESKQVKPDEAFTGKEIRRKLVGKVEDGVHKMDKKLLKKYTARLQVAQSIIDNTPDLITNLLDSDYSFSINDTLKVSKKLAKKSEKVQDIENKIVELSSKIDPETGKPYTETDKGSKQLEHLLKQLESTLYKSEKDYSAIQLSTLQSEEGEDTTIEIADTESLNPEEELLQKEGFDVDKTDTDASFAIKRLLSRIDTLKTGVAEWADRKGKSDQQSNELNYLSAAVDTIKTIAKSEEQVNISKTTQEQINKLLEPEFVIDALDSVLNEDNARSIYKKLENNENKKHIVKMYKKIGYDKIRKFVSDFMEEHNIAKRKSTQATETITQEKIIQELEVAVESEEHETLGQALVEITENPDYAEEPSVEEEVRVLTGVVETDESDAQKIAENIKELIDNAVEKMSQMQLTKATVREYHKVSVSMIAHNVFHEINDRNYSRVREIISSNPTALAVFDEAMTMITGANSGGKFSQEFVDKVQNLSRESGTASAQRQALQAALLKTIRPVTNMVKEIRDSGYDVDVNEDFLKTFEPTLDVPAKIKLLEFEVKSLEDEIADNKDNDVQQTALTKELFNKTNELAAYKNGDVLSILDWMINNIETFEGLNASQKKIQDLLKKFLDAAIVAEETGKDVEPYLKDPSKNIKAFPKLREKVYKVLRKVNNFRMWAMTSSPVSWVRNWVGNFGMKTLDAVTNATERWMNKTINIDDKIKSDSVKFNTTKGGKELSKHISEKQGDYIKSMLRGENKYQSEEAKTQRSRQIREKQYEDANGFKKLLLKAQDFNEWGLSTGPLGDDAFVYADVCTNMSNLVASSKDYLLKGISTEFDRLDNLNKADKLSENQKKRYAVCAKAVSNPTLENIFDAIHPTEMKQLLNSCHDRAKEQFFKNPNKISKWMNNLAEKSPITHFLMSWVVPFPKVASNIMVMAARYSPLGFVNAFANFSKASQVNGELAAELKQQGIRNIAEAEIGTVALLAGVLFAALGWVDIEEDDYMGLSLKMGDVRISLSDMAPSMTTFSAAAAFVYGWKADKNGFETMLQTLYDNTLLGNIDNAFRYSSPEKYAENLSISFFSSFIPAFVKLMNKWTTNNALKDKSGSYWSKLAKTMGSYIPGISQLVPNKINPYTGEVATATGSVSGWFNFFSTLSPLQIEKTERNALAEEAYKLKTETTGFSGKFTINDKEYSISNKEVYSKFRANYISDMYDKIAAGTELVTIKDDTTGKYKTIKYASLNDAEKKRVLSNIYSKGTELTKIKYWLDSGNTYIVTDKSQYKEYKKLFGGSAKIVYKNKWSTSKFVEG